MLVADRDLMDLKVTQLKDELKERGEKRTGNKAWLRRRLHSTILADHIATRNRMHNEILSTSGEESGGDDESGDGGGGVGE